MEKIFESFSQFLNEKTEPKYSKELAKELAKIYPHSLYKKNVQLGFMKYDGVYDGSDEDFANADSIYIGWDIDENPIQKTIRLKKVNTLDSLKKDIQDILMGGQNKQFMEAIKIFCDNNGFNFGDIGTSYGIQSDGLRGRKENNITKALDEKGVIYKREFSDARWIDKIIISKSKENIAKLKSK